MTSLADHARVARSDATVASARRRLVTAAMAFVALLGVLVGLMLALG
jgi:hypothetical protein